MTTTATFQTNRQSGQTNQEVIAALVASQPPGTVFTYDQFLAALSAGTDTVYDRAAVQQCVRLANRRLLREHKRYLRNVPNVGYRMIPAGEHCEVARQRNRRADRQVSMAMQTLRNARMEEMTPDEAARHNAQLIVNESMLSAMRHQRQQAERTAQLVANLSSRVEQLEAKKQG